MLPTTFRQDSGDERPPLRPSTVELALAMRFRVIGSTFALITKSGLTSKASGELEYA
jgi:hypothetical protein